MKVLHVVATYLPAVRYGGTITSVHGLCRTLAARGHQVHVFTTSVDGPTDSDVPHDRAVTIDGVSVHYFPSRYGRRVYWSPPMGRALRERVREFDIVHTHAIYLWPLWTAAHRARKANVPYIVSPRGMLEKGLIARQSPVAKSLLIGMVEKRVLENAAAIHVTSEREAAEARAFGFDLPVMVTIPNGIDVEATRSSLSEFAGVLPDRYALFLGRLNWKKGLDRLVAALSYAPGQRLVIAGPDEAGYRATVERLARDAGVAERIVFLGPVTGGSKAALIERADCL
ncbi:MAG TPA: glycosyltransferase, partial [Vicinamibacterales bacterium]|nr:glycosyltransferase [Vicinamibacterales bacterium]